MHVAVTEAGIQHYHKPCLLPSNFSHVRRRGCGVFTQLQLPQQ